MKIQQDVSLKQFNTFAIDVKARQFAVFTSQDELEELLSFIRRGSFSHLILGGGSNILFTKDVDGLVLKNECSGVQITGEDEEFVYVKAGAGENWHGFVMHCIQNNWGGVENLSLIPGNVGASPMQNVGAYGVEIKDVFEELEAYDIYDQAIVRFSNSDCKFGYRDSVFKQRYKNRFAILNVTFRLRKQPQFHTSYGAINAELEAMGVAEMNIQNISQAVISIRSSKLPDPKQVGNAGSFFKNPSISATQYEQLKSEYPAMVAYANDDGTMKLAAGWLIEQCGWKGYRKGDAGCHAKQALVLVNYGIATGREIQQLSEDIKRSVAEKFKVNLETEVNIV